MSDWNSNTQKLLALKKKKFKKKEEPAPVKVVEFYPKEDPQIFDYPQPKDENFSPKEDLSEIINKQSQGEMMINEFLDDGEQLEFDFFENGPEAKSTKKQEKINTRDVHFLMEKYKEENGGKGTEDICILFSYWQINFGPKDDEKTLINYNSKSFNNKTYFNRPISMDRSPMEFNLDPID